MSLGPLMISLRGVGLAPEERRWLASPAVGGVVLFARNFVSVEQLVGLVEDVHAVRSPPLLVAVDHEGGRVQRFAGPFYRLPPMRALGHLHDRDATAADRTAFACGWMMAAELRAVGLDLSFAPVVDLDRGLSEVIGDRALHSSPEVVTRLAARFSAGAHEAGMVICAKHFPTHSGATADSHAETAVDRREYADLADDLLPYRRLIDTGLHAIMVAHVVFPKLDASPASLSPWWVKRQLRNTLGFTGAIISDDMNMAGVQEAGETVGRIRKSIDAGCDLVLLCNVLEEVPAVLESLAGYVNPAGQLRLMRLRGREHASSWDVLHASEQWRHARALLDELSAVPKLELRG